MSGLGQKRRFGRAPITSGLPRQADVFIVRRHVSKVPTTDVRYIVLVRISEPRRARRS
jgi:hypothetical protein